MQAVLLAAGQGVRMRPMTHDRPKSLLNVAGEPVLHHLMRGLSRCGYDEVLLIVGHGADQVRSYVGDGDRHGLHVEYRIQPKRLGPGHALLQARDAISEDFLLLAADAWYDDAILQALGAATGPTLLQVKDDRASRHGIPVIRAGKAVDLQEGPGEGHPSGGAYCLPGDIFESIQPGHYALRDAIRRDMREGSGAWDVIEASRSQYIDLIEPQDFLRLNDLLLDDNQTHIDGTVEEGATLHGAVRIGKGSVVRSGSVIHGPVSIGRDCDIGPHAVLQPGTAVRNRVRIEPFTLLRHCSVASNVNIGSHGRFQQVLIDNGADIGSMVRIEGDTGAIVGSDAEIGDGATVAAGGNIGRLARIAEGRSVHTVPDEGVAV